MILDKKEKLGYLFLQMNPWNALLIQSLFFHLRWVDPSANILEHNQQLICVFWLCLNHFLSYTMHDPYISVGKYCFRISFKHTIFQCQPNQSRRDINYSHSFTYTISWWSNFVNVNTINCIPGAVLWWRLDFKTCFSLNFISNSLQSPSEHSRKIVLLMLLGHMSGFMNSEHEVKNHNKRKEKHGTKQMRHFTLFLRAWISCS